MPNRPIEHILRKRLGQHPTPLDTDALWAKVEPRLPQKRPIFSLWKWMVFSLVLLGSIYLFLPQKVEDEFQVALPAPVAIETASKTSTAPAPAPKRIVREVPPENISTSESIPKAVVTFPITRSVPKQENRRAQDQEEVIAKTERELQKKYSRQDWLQGRESAKADAIAQKESARLETQRRLEAIEAKKKQDKLTREILKRNKAKYAKADKEARLNEIGQRHLKRMKNRLARQEARQVANALAKTNNEKPKDIRQRQPAYWTVEPGIAISIPSRSVNIAGDNPNEGQVSVNEQYEKALEAFTLQGLIGYHRPSGFSLRTWITNNNINSKVESEFTIIGTEFVQTVVAIIESPNGSRREQTGTVEVTTETKTTERYYNSVSSIDLPVLLGYRLGGTKWGLTVEAGPTFNLGSNGNAHLYDGAGNYRSVSSGHFRNKLTGPGFLASLGGAYNLSAQTMLTANLRIQGFGKGGFENPSSGYATKYTLIGIQLGYRVRF